MQEELLSQQLSVQDLKRPAVALTISSKKKPKK